MLCSRCRAVTESKQLDLQKYNIAGEVFRIDCKICGSFVALRANDEIINIDEAHAESGENCWKEANTRRERIVYYVLNLIVYPELDPPNADKFESLYDFADDFDKVMLRWENGKAIGFYTVKPKGTEIFGTMESYAMTTLDTAYIRSEYRNRGLGLGILSDIVNRFPDENVGFSRPISEGMTKVLKKFLTEHKEYRTRFWEIEGGGNEGSQKLIWCVLKKNFK